jgi:plastocyanin
MKLIRLLITGFLALILAILAISSCNSNPKTTAAATGMSIATTAFTPLPAITSNTPVTLPTTSVTTTSANPITTVATSTTIPVTTAKPVTTTPTATQSAVVNQVSIQNFAFSPSTLTVPSGTTVIWTNKDSAHHTVTGDTWQSSNLATNQTYSRTFSQAGTYSYHCSIHPSMTGSILVQ